MKREQRTGTSWLVRCLSLVGRPFDFSGQPYDEDELDLGLQIRDHEGLIEITNWYDETDPLTGAADNEIQSHQIQRGRLGTPILLDEREYVRHTVGSGDEELSTFRVRKETTYRSESGGGDPVSTEYEASKSR